MPLCRAGNSLCIRLGGRDLFGIASRDPLIRPGVMKIFRFLDYHDLTTIEGERRFLGMLPDRAKNLLNNSVGP